MNPNEPAPSSKEPPRRRWSPLAVAAAAIVLILGGAISGWVGRDYFLEKLAPTWAYGTFMDANESYDDGQWETATAKLYESAHWYPEWYSPHLMLAQIFVEQEYWALAEEHLLIAEEKFQNPLTDLFESYPQDLEEIERLKNNIREQTAGLAVSDGVTKKEVDLEHDLRFLYAYKGRFAIGLPSEYSTPTILQKMTEDLGADKFDYFSSIPPSDDLKTLADELGQPLGTRYRLLMPPKASSRTHTLVGYGLLPTGDGGVAGVVGILDGGREYDDRESFRPIGVAWQTDSDTEGASKFSAPVAAEPLTDVEHLQLQETFGSAADWALNELHVGPPRSALVYVSDAQTSSKVLYCVILDQDLARIVEFPRSANGGLLLHDGQGDADTTPRDGDAYFLPDLNGDHLPEIIICSTTSEIYTLKRDTQTTKISLELLEHTYFGP